MQSDKQNDETQSSAGLGGSSISQGNAEDTRHLSRKWKLAKVTTAVAFAAWLIAVSLATAALYHGKISETTWLQAIQSISGTWLFVTFGVIAGYGLGNVATHITEKWNGGK